MKHYLMKIQYLDWALWSGAIALILELVYGFVLPVKHFLVLTIFLVIADLITGILAAKHRKEIISSWGLRRSIIKVSVYFIAILLSEGMRIVFIKELPIPFVIAFAIAATEFKSNLENIECITGTTLWSLISERFKHKKL